MSPCSKTVSAAVVAMLCLAGGSFLIQDVSDADVGYSVHLELYGKGSGDVTSGWFLPHVEEFSDAGLSAYEKAVTIAVGGGDNIEIEEITGEITMISYGKEFRPSSTLDEGGFYGFLAYYLDQDEWKQMVVVDDYDRSTHVAVYFGQIYNQTEYDGLPDDVKGTLVQVKVGDAESGYGTGYAKKITETGPGVIHKAIDIMLVLVLVVAGITFAAFSAIIYRRYRRYRGRSRPVPSARRTAMATAASAVRALISARSPGKRKRRHSVPSAPEQAMNTVPTGFPGTAPPGPAIPVTAT